MAKATDVLSTQGEPASKIPSGFSGSEPAPDSLFPSAAAQAQASAEALLILARLRKQASAEITRLIGFLDETDGYSTSELEPNGDELDANHAGDTLVREETDDAEEDRCDFEDDGTAEDCEPSGIGDADGLQEQLGVGFARAE